MNSKKPIKLWHGGAPGLKVGGELLPPSETNFVRTSEEINGEAPEGFTRSYRKDRVYATNDREFAEVFARLYTQDDERPGDGMVYEVELVDAVLDPDMSTFKVMWEGTRGRILKPGMPVRTSIKRLDYVLEYYKARGRAVNEERRAAALADEDAKPAD